VSTTELTRRGRALSELRPRLGAVLPSAGLAGASMVVVVGLSLGQRRLGLPLPPFLMYWGPSVDQLAVVSVATFAVALAVAPAIVTRVRTGVAFAACIYVLALALGLSLNLAHFGVTGWASVFQTGRGGSVEGAYEYLPGLPALVHGIPYYLGHFAALFPYLPLHAQGNPPGPLVALDLLGIRTADAMAALCIGLGALTAPLAYDLGRVLGGEQRGRIAGVLTAFSPSILLFGVTSADYAFATLGLVAACLLVRPRTAALVAGGIAAALAAFFSWLLLATPAWAALVVLRRDGWRAGVRVGVAAGVGVAAFNLALFVIFGYDPFAALRATANVYYHGTWRYRPYSFWVFGSPTAWAVMLGLPIMWFALRALSAGDAAAIAVWAMVAVASLLGTTGGETERIWLPFTPLACVAAAAALPPGRLRPILLLLAGQALLVELLFFTVW
jgi:methylthioxylose transferase